MKGFLLDEHVLVALKRELLRREPTMLVFRIGDGEAPRIGTPDPDILEWIERRDCMLVTRNRASMPGHLSTRREKGGHVPGIIQLPRLFRLTAIVEDLILIWAAAIPGEFRDRILYLPLLP